MKHGETMQDWEKVYDENANALLLYARQWTGSLVDAEDAVQEGFVKVCRSQPQDPERIRPLLFKAVKWSALDKLRKQRRREQRETLVMETTPDAAWFESGLENREFEEGIAHAMKQLPDEQREVLVMKIWGGLSFKDIAETLDIPQGTAASRYRYALDAVREFLKPELNHGQQTL